MTVQKNDHGRSILIPLAFKNITIKALLLLLHALPYATAQTGTEFTPPLSVPDQFAPRVGPQFNPSVAIIMVALVSAFFLMGFFSVYIRHCAERHISVDQAAVIGGGGRGSRRAARGIDSAIIETFPTFVYSTVKGHKIGKGSLECAVCLNEFEDDEMLRLIPKCSHVFHPECIDAWLSSNTTCPVCRANLVPKAGEISSFPAIQILDLDRDPGEPEHRPDNNVDRQSSEIIPIFDGERIGLESPDLNLINSSLGKNQNRPPRSRSTGWRFSGLFPRSHSTGHSLVQPSENCERFTLRLPEEVRSLLMNRTKSCVAFPRVRSSKRGYRSEYGKNYFYYERFDREGQLDRRMTPPFFSRTGSVGSTKIIGGGEVGASPPKSLFKSLKSPFERMFHGTEENVGERSSDRLRPDNQV